MKSGNIRLIDSNKRSNFKILMDCFNTKLKDIVNIVHIDYSMVSKWRNGVRRLKIESDYVKKIVDYYIRLDQPYGYIRIKRLLSVNNSDVDSYREDELIKSLKTYITSYSEDNIPTIQLEKSKSYTTQITVYCYNEGREKAAFLILEELSNMDKGQEFYIFDREEKSWSNEKSCFKKRRDEKFGTLSEKHNFKIIHTLNANQTTLMNLIERDLNLNIKKNVNTYYLPMNKVPEFLSDILIIKNKAALICQHNQGVHFQQYAEYHTDFRSVLYYQELYGTLLKKSTPFYLKYFSYNRNILIDYIYRNIERSASTYVSSNMPSFLSMPIEIVETYQSVYNTSYHVKNSVKLFRQLQLKWIISLRYSKHRHIYNLDQIENFFVDGENDFCSFFEFPKKISKEEFKKHLKNIIELLKTNENFEIALVNNLPTMNANNVSIMIEKNIYSIIYATNRLKKDFIALVAKDPTINHTIYNHYNDYWENIPSLQKNKEWVINVFENLINRFT